MKTVTNVNVNGNPIEVDLEDIDLQKNPVFPFQDNVIIGSSGYQEFKIDDSIYSSDTFYPGDIYEDYSIGYSHG